MIELLMVIVIIGILSRSCCRRSRAAMRTGPERGRLVRDQPARNRPLRTSSRKYGDYPPSRVPARSRAGITANAIGSNSAMRTVDPTSPDRTTRQTTSRGSACAAVADRHAQVFPEGRLQHDGDPPNHDLRHLLYDFNGNGVDDVPRPMSCTVTNAWSSSWAAYRRRAPFR